MESKFKVLMWNGIYVDEALLRDGLYAIKIPKLYPEDTTLVNIIKMYENFYVEYISIRPKDFFVNIKKCELVTVSIKIIK